MPHTNSITFRRDVDVYFDRLLDFVLASACYSQMLAIHADSAAMRWQVDEPLGVRGIICNSVLNFYPAELLDEMSQGRRPVEMRCVEVIDPIASPAPLRIHDTRSFLDAQVHAMFAGLYDQVYPDIEAMFGPKTECWKKWPLSINYARVVRNALSHGGSIHFEKQAPWRSVFWRGKWLRSTYDNGIPLASRVGPVDFIYLMMEIGKIIRASAA